MRPLALILVLSGVCLVLPGTLGAEWGVHSVGPGAAVDPPVAGQDQWVCVASDAAGPVALTQDQPEGEPVERSFSPEAGAPDCRMLPTEPLHVHEDQGGTLRVLLLGKPPQAATSPGVVRLATPGVALALERVTEDTEIGVLPNGAGVRVEAVRAADLQVLRTVEGGGEERFRLDGAAAEQGVWIVLVSAGEGATALVDWEDPTWFPRAPTIGHVAVVVAVALFLILYHGRSPRRLG